MNENRTITAIRGIKAGHWTDHIGKTGCTVILCPPEGAVASASFFGPSPGTREGILLSPEKKVERIHALLLTGGSAFGLAAADGVVAWLEEQGIGHKTPAARVPIVPAAVIYDLLQGDPKARPNAESGRLACEAASSAPLQIGRVGAGTGASAGKYVAPVPTGLGSSLAEFEGARVGVVAVVNPVGDVTSPEGQIVAGHGDRDAFLHATIQFGNTTLLAVAIEAPISKCQARQLADTAQSALARVIRPSHTIWDGDSAFLLSTGNGPEASMATLSVLVQEAVEQAVVSAIG